GLRSSNDITELICLLPNGLPAIRIINETVVLSPPLSSRSTYMYVVQSKSELVNYTLSYFNVTAFNELISMARSREMANYIM
ncbi:hypothetical protein, partial [Vulcanisaeta souniana]|uniref:hypothetical protein n=1 Tax=Vulcanisaeta souniana TaxID=164452 RepID=UPI000A810D03